MTVTASLRSRDTPPPLATFGQAKFNGEARVTSQLRYCLTTAVVHLTAATSEVVKPRLTKLSGLRREILGSVMVVRRGLSVPSFEGKMAVLMGVGGGRMTCVHPGSRERNFTNSGKGVGH